MNGPGEDGPIGAGKAVVVPDSGTRDALADGADRAGALSSALATLGMHCIVEARGSLAVVSPADGRQASVASLTDHALRDAVVNAAHDLGFTNIALELRGEDG
ncbi:MAG: hypothetical protein ACYC2G_01205 [Gemmatimonadaceae bacterium]